jgi:hypothetical protein
MAPTPSAWACLPSLAQRELIEKELLPGEDVQTDAEIVPRQCARTRNTGIIPSVHAAWVCTKIPVY